MAENINKLLKKSRSAKHGWITRLVNECNDLLVSDQLTYNKLSRQVDSLKTKWDSYQASHDLLETKLIETGNSKEYDDYQKEHNVIETEYLTELNKFEAKLDELTTTPHAGNPTTELPRLTLPTITLPEFNGDISEWPAFWDKFNGLIHARKDIPKINKFSYLLGQLKTTALLLVSQLAVTEDNYDIAIKLLKDNYEDKDQITTKLVNKLINLKTPNHNYEDLQLFRITVNSVLESLRLNNDVDAAAWLLKIIIQNKLNKKTMETLYFKYSKSYFSLQEIDETLLEICKTLCNEEQARKLRPDSSTNVMSQGKRKTAFRTPKYQDSRVSDVSVGLNKQIHREIPEPIPGLNTIGSYTTSVNKTPSTSSNNKASSSGTKPKVYRCVFCSEQHNSRYCEKFKGTKQRKERLNQLGKCTLCLSSYHQVRDCRTKLNKCSLCKEGIHHVVLCEGQSDGFKPSPSPSNNAPNYSAAVPVAEVHLQSKE